MPTSTATRPVSAHARRPRTAAALRVLTNPAVLWLVVAALAVRFVVDNATSSDRLDGISFLDAGRLLLHHPGALYDGVVSALSAGHLPVHGLMHPPAAAALAAPFTLLPGPWDITVFTVAGALAALAGLLLIERAVAPRGALRPLFWIVALYFPPLYADVVASQFGGFLLGLTGAALYLNTRRRPVWAGALAGAAAAIKLYPAAMLTGALRRRGARFGLALLGVAVIADLGLFIPLGQTPLHYLTTVLLPSLSSPHPDCAMTGIDTLFSRALGGVAYPVIGADGGLVIMRSPLALPWLGTALRDVTLIGCVAGAGWAALRSRGHRLYAPAIGLALGGIIPGELLPYQYLPLLPVVLIVLTDAMRRHRTLPAALIGIGLVGLLRQPCQLSFPNLWTLAGLVLFATCVAAAPQFDAKPRGRAPFPA